MLILEVLAFLEAIGDVLKEKYLHCSQILVLVERNLLFGR